MNGAGETRGGTAAVSEKARAKTLYHEGRRQEALARYARANELDPGDIEAWFLQGLIHGELGNYRAAAACYHRVLKLNPEFAEAHYNLGDLARVQGHMPEAEQNFREALRLKPEHAEGHFYLGSVLRAQHRLDEAEICLRRALRLNPSRAAAHSLLGEILLGQDRPAEAELAYREALRLQPGCADDYFNLGHALCSRARFNEAIGYFHEVLRRCPAHHGALFGIALALKSTGQLRESAEYYKRFLRLKPEVAEAWNNLGVIYNELRELNSAAEAYKSAVHLSPDNAQIHNNLGNTFTYSGRYAEAEASLRRAIELRPDYPEAYTNLGVLYAKQARYAEAISCYTRALELRPDFWQAHNNLAKVYCDLGRLDEAEERYQALIELRPNFAEAHASLLSLLNYRGVRTPAEVFAEHRRWGERFGKAEARLKGVRNGRDPERRLRVGYVSPDFREHSVAYFLEGLLACHDRAQVEVFCYAQVARPDETTARFKGCADQWRDIAGHNDRAVAEEARAEQIDILVDLAGHTENNRLGVFALKPAPVQVSWLGYPNTTGLSAIDYRLTDGWADPPGGTDAYYTEELVRLPHGFLCYTPPHDAPAVGAAPSRAKGYVTFGSFNNLAKVTPEVVRVWAQILRAVPGARLFLKSRALHDRQTRERLWGLFEAQGIAAQRIELRGTVTGRRAHLELYRELDIALDTFPYTGTTTSCEALWMGVPIITLAGHCHAGRVGVSLLNQAGLTKWIAADESAYIAKALELAADPARLAELRAALRVRMAASPLCDGARFARDVEAAYRAMWRSWCAAGG